MDNLPTMTDTSSAAEIVMPNNDSRRELAQSGEVLNLVSAAYELGGLAVQHGAPDYECSAIDGLSDDVEVTIETLSDIDGGIFRSCLTYGSYEPFSQRKVEYRKDVVAASKTSFGDDDSARVYLNAMGEFMLLTPESEVYLSKYIQAGLLARAKLGLRDGLSKKQYETYSKLVDKIDSGVISPAQSRQLRRVARDGLRARNIMIESNLRLVVSIAKQYLPRVKNMDIKDLIQEGNLGLMTATEKFDWRKGFRFSTYATNWIRQSVTRGINTKENAIRKPSHSHDEIAQINRVIGAFIDQQDHSRALSTEEISKQTGLSVDRVIDYLPYTGNGGQIISLSKSVGEDGDSELSDSIGDPSSELVYDRAVLAVDLHLLRSMIEKLIPDARDREILMDRLGMYGEPRTLDELGKRFGGLSRERIRQIEKQSREKLVGHAGVDDAFVGKTSRQRGPDNTVKRKRKPRPQ